MMSRFKTLLYQDAGRYCYYSGDILFTDLDAFGGLNICFVDAMLVICLLYIIVI